MLKGKEREKQVMSGESKGVTRLNKVMIAECCYRLVLKGDKKLVQSYEADVTGLIYCWSLTSSTLWDNHIFAAVSVFFHEGKSTAERKEE